MEARGRHQHDWQPVSRRRPGQSEPKVPAYWVVNLHSSYQVTKNIEVFGLVRNLFNRRYYTFGSFFQTDLFPYLGLTDPRTFVPGAPLAVYAGLRAKW